MNLGQLFEDEHFTLEHLEKVEDKNEYWYSSIQFVRDKWNTDLVTMSEKQFKWAHKILEDLIEMRCTNRELFILRQ